MLSDAGVKDVFSDSFRLEGGGWNGFWRAAMETFWGAEEWHVNTRQIKRLHVFLKYSYWKTKK